MKVAIIFSDGVKQINFTAENDDEKQALKLITPNDNIQLAVKQGSFGNQGQQPFTVGINGCNGGYLRCFDSSDSIMLVLSPKTEVLPINGEQKAIEFTKSKLSNVSIFLSEDYKTGFKEGVEKYIESLTNGV